MYTKRFLAAGVGVALATEEGVACFFLLSGVAEVGAAFDGNSLLAGAGLTTKGVINDLGSGLAGGALLLLLRLGTFTGVTGVDEATGVALALDLEDIEGAFE